jgi:hypothetical protein
VFRELRDALLRRNRLSGSGVCSRCLPPDPSIFQAVLETSGSKSVIPKKKLGNESALKGIRAALAQTVHGRRRTRPGSGGSALEATGLAF